MKKLYSILLLLTLFSWACGSDDSSSSAGDASSSGDGVYLNQNLPTKYKVDTPDTVKVSGSLGKAAGRNAGGGCFNDITQNTGAASSGYGELRFRLCEMETNTIETELNLMLLDAALPKMRSLCGASAATAEGCSLAEGAVKITFTTAMVKKMEELFAQFGGADMAAPDGSAGPMGPQVGEVMPMPPTTYREVAAAEKYDYSVTLSPSPEFQDPSMQQDFSFEIKWNSEKTEILLQDKFSLSFDDGMGGSMTDIGQRSFEYSDADKAMKFRFSSEQLMNGTPMGKFSDSISAKQCKLDQPDLKCVEVKANNTFDDGSMKFSTDIFGVADNEGGVVESSFTFPDCCGGSTKDQFREYFNTAGSLIFAETYNNLSGMWEPFAALCMDCSYDPANDPYYNTVYDETGQSNLDFGGLAVVVSNTGALAEGDFFLIVPGGTQVTAVTGGVSLPPDRIIGDGSFFGGQAVANFFGTADQLNAGVDVYKEVGFNETTYEPIYQKDAAVVITAAGP